MRYRDKKKIQMGMKKSEIEKKEWKYRQEVHEL